MAYSRIYSVRLVHGRSHPVKHSFIYKLYFFGIDLDELSSISKRMLFFSYNKANLLSICDKDYLNNQTSNIKEKLLTFLNKTVNCNNINRIELITVPRYFCYVFNPVSFYICYRADNTIYCVAAEVNNTYGERHLYILNKKAVSGLDIDARYVIPKEFFVSPYNGVVGEYEFLFSVNNQDLDIRINVLNQDKPFLTTHMLGESKPMSNANLVKTVLSFPLSPLLTMIRIALQSIQLKRKSLKPLMKPKPNSKMTIKHSTTKSFYERLTHRFYHLKQLLGLRKFL